MELVRVRAGIAVSIANRLRAGRLGFGSWLGLRIFSFATLWDTPSFLSNGYRGSFPRGKVAGTWSWPLTSI